jgi:CBS domain containing-hemolysin-like protein
MAAREEEENKPDQPGSAGRRWWQKFFSGQDRQTQLEKSIEKLGLEFSTSENVLEEDEREMIHGIVELGETEVREVMVPRVEIVGIECGAPVHEVIETIRKSGHSRFPLFEESLDNIKGILYAKDLLPHLAGGGAVDLQKIVRKPYFIPESIRLDRLLRDMKKKRLHIAIVVDEYGGTSGLVTMEDILEEIVGEIEDEYDGEPPAIMKQSPGVFLVGGSVTISDLNDEAGLDLPEEEFETVGGLMYDLVGSIPEKGKAVEYHRVTFIAEQIEGQRIVKVRVVANYKTPGGKKAAPEA